jgi:hypothetical protein
VETESVKTPFIQEAAFEQRYRFGGTWLDKWTLPNPFALGLVEVLRSDGVELKDISFSQDAKTLADVELLISIRSLGTEVSVGLDRIRFLCSTPSWEVSPQLISVLARIMAEVQKIAGSAPVSQSSTLAFHLAPGSVDFGVRTAELVNTERLGRCDFYGVSLYHPNGRTLIEKSLKFDGSAFILLQFELSGEVSLSDVALQLYERQKEALRLLGAEAVL